MKSRIVRFGSEDPKKLKANPKNWRKHPEAQRSALVGVLEQIGWVQGVVVNERTGNIVDGHLRVDAAIKVGEKTVPVCYVDLSPEDEELALATLDPLSAMAQVDKTALASLAEQLKVDDLWVREMLHNTLAGPDAEETEEQDEAVQEAKDNWPAMQVQPFEHYDYVMLLFKNEQDFQQACEKLKIGKVKIDYPGGQKKVGLGRCIDGAKAMRMLSGEKE